MGGVRSGDCSVEIVYKCGADGRKVDNAYTLYLTTVSTLNLTFIAFVPRCCVSSSADTFYDCLVIACMRRLQEWSYVSILGEFRHLTWPHKLFDFEQVVDQFHTSLVDITAATPEFLALHDNFKVGNPQDSPWRFVYPCCVYH